MKFSLSSLLDRWSRVAIAGCVVYACAIGWVILSGWGGEALTGWVSAWGNFVFMGVILVMLWPVIRDPALSWRRRRAFQLLFAAQVLDLVASIGWAHGALTASETWGSWPDVIWIFWYAFATGALLLLYFELGGKFA